MLNCRKITAVAYLVVAGLLMALLIPMALYTIQDAFFLLDATPEALATRPQGFGWAQILAIVGALCPLSLLACGVVNLLAALRGKTGRWLPVGVGIWLGLNLLPLLYRTQTYSTIGVYLAFSKLSLTDTIWPLLLSQWMLPLLLLVSGGVALSLPGQEMPALSLAPKKHRLLLGFGTAWAVLSGLFMLGSIPEIPQYLLQRPIERVTYLTAYGVRLLLPIAVAVLAIVKHRKKENTRWVRVLAGQVGLMGLVGLASFGDTTYYSPLTRLPVAGESLVDYLCAGLAVWVAADTFVPFLNRLFTPLCIATGALGTVAPCGTPSSSWAPPCPPGQSFPPPVRCSPPSPPASPGYSCPWPGALRPWAVS